MKKILFSISALAVAFGFTACSSEDEVLSNVKDGKTTVTAMTETSTRTALAEDGEGAYDVVWSKGDKITIGGKEFTLEEGVGETSAKFTGTAPADGEYTAYYATADGNVPTKQVYKEGAISNFPMTATATVTDGKISPLSFKNVGGLLQLTVTNSGPDYYKLAGFTFNAAGLAKPYSLVCEDLEWAQLDDEIVFNLALPEGEYTNVVITLYDSEYRTCVKTLKSGSLKIERSKITKASFTLKEEVNFIYPEISYESPVGSVGMIDGRVGIVAKFSIYGNPNYPLIIAAMNEGATSMTDGAGSTDYQAACYGDYMSKDECLEYKDQHGWALMTSDEFDDILDPYYNTDPFEKWFVKGKYVGHIVNVTDMVKVYFPAAGVVSDSENKFTGESGWYALCGSYNTIDAFYCGDGLSNNGCSKQTWTEIKSHFSYPAFSLRLYYY